MSPPIDLPPLRSMSFHYSDVELLSYGAGAVLAEEATTGHTLFVFKGGNGKLYAETFQSVFSSDGSYLLPPSCAYQLESHDDSRIEVYRITFQAFRIANGRAEPYGPLFPGREELRVYPQAHWIELINQLHAGRNDTETYGQQLQFQKIMAALLGQHWRTDQPEGVSHTVEQTIRFLRTHYRNPITVAQLARMANVPSWQYTSLFKERTGKKPLDYLTEVRVNRAKEWLTDTEYTLREIAERVGFADEYYFSRRFRHLTGFSPRQYAVSMRKNVLVKDWNGHEVPIPSNPSRVLYCGETTGDLSILGIPLVDKQLFCKETPLDPEAASEIAPDLIIYDHSDESLYSRISRIAPTLAYNSRGSLDERLLMLGDWFGKRAEAQTWLQRYNSRSLRMWQELSPQLRPEETASVFVFHRGKRLFVMGNIGLSSILYHPAGFRPAGKARQLMESGRPYKEITPATLPQYAGDRVFMLLPESPESKSAMEDLINDSLWRNLPAVKNGFSYLLDERDWNQEDATTRANLLSLLPRLLTRSS